MRRLILNADDFGLTRGINRAVAELHDSGALTSATLMAAGPAFTDAVAIAIARPTLGIGCHIVLVDGSPVSPPNEIPTLLGADGRNFRTSLLHFLRDLYTNKISLAEVEREAAAQIQKLQQAGIAVTHIDTHKHLHIFPRITTALLSAATRCGIRAIRNPFEQSWSRRLSDAHRLRSLEVAALHSLRNKFHQQLAFRNHTVHTTSGTIGIAVTGTLTAASLRAMFAAMPPGTWELVCHPGYNDADLDRVRTRLRSSRETERIALLTEIPQLIKNHSRIELIHYGKILSEDGSVTNGAAQ